MKYLALDIGNVLCDVNFEPFLDCCEYDYDIDNKNAMQFLESVQTQHDVGLVRLIDEFSKRFKVADNLKIERAWNECLIPNKTSFRYLQSLLNDGWKIAILSNIGFEHRDLFSTLLSKKIADHQLTYHMSCDVGARKPTLLYYQSFLIQNPEFKGCVYVDDREDNLLTGSKLGFISIKLDTTKLSKPELNQTWRKIKETVLYSSGEPNDQ